VCISHFHWHAQNTRRRSSPSQAASLEVHRTRDTDPPAPPTGVKCNLSFPLSIQSCMRPSDGDANFRARTRIKRKKRRENISGPRNDTKQVRAAGCAAVASLPRLAVRLVWKRVRSETLLQESKKMCLRRGFGLTYLEI
jgi:hypothetical protein